MRCQSAIHSSLSEFLGDAPDLLSGSNLGGDPETTIVIFDSSRSGWPESGALFGGLPDRKSVV